MLKYGNRDFRNLQEQVYANMKNIEDIIEGSNIIADLKTVNIVGQVDEAADLPDADTYEGNYGDAFLVGDEEAADLYVFTKAYENENAPQWFNVGAYPQPGPQGPKGDKGDPGEGIKDASELLEFMEGSDAVSVALNQAETKVKVDLSDAEKAIIGNTLQLPENAPASQQLVGVNTSKVQNALGIGGGLEVYNNELKAKVGTGIEINASGELTANIPNALVLPESAPAADQLVGVNTSNEQIAVTIGENLNLTNTGVLSSPFEIYKLDANGSGSAVYISDALYEKLQNKNALIYLYNTNGTGSNGALFASRYGGTPWYQITLDGDDNTSSVNNGFTQYNTANRLKLISAGAEGNRYLSLNNQAINKPILGISGPDVVIFTSASGTKTMSIMSENAKNKFYSYFLYQIDGKYVRLFIQSISLSSPVIVKAQGKSDGITYNLEWNLQTKAYTITTTTSTNIGEKTIYVNSAASVSLGTFVVYIDDYGTTYIEIPSTALSFKVLDQSSNEITVANKTILDYKKNSSATIKLMVATDGTNYYLEGGLYESVKISLGFTKPTTAVGAIDFKVTVGSYVLSPNVLYAKSEPIDSIPTQYNGITRSSITALDITGGSFLKAVGSPITFGTDTDVSLSFCLDDELVKGIDATAA